MSGYLQQPPELRSAWEGDADLRAVVRWYLGEDLFEKAREELVQVGQAVRTRRTLGLMLQAEQQPPRHLPFSAWGRRIDEIEVSPAYLELGRMGVSFGVTALPYEGEPYGSKARVVWAALLAMWGPSSALYSCPVAMTDAAARTLLIYGGPEESATVDRLTTRDPERAWTSGQWMTETTGGSDVGRTETVARRDGDSWRLFGTKWFTSATTSEMALTLARPEGAPEGSRGLALFKVMRIYEGGPNAIEVRRLKDKLGTRAMPTAELELRGAIATPIGDPEGGGGLRRIATMLNITRLHNALGAVGSMALGLAWADSFARVREVFGRPLIEQPLHRATLDSLAVDHLASLVLTFRCAELTGLAEHGAIGGDEEAILRGLTPVTKLATARWAVEGAAEAMEALGGVGYCEDSGLPALVRNAHVLPIWEGTTNVLSLDLLRAQLKSGSIDAILSDARRAISRPGIDPDIRVAVENSCRTLRGAMVTIAEDEGGEAGARSLALGIARTYACALLAQMALAMGDRATGAAQALIERGLVLPLPLKDLPGWVGTGPNLRDAGVEP